MNTTKLQKFALPGMVCGIAAYQVYDDYKNADISDKKNVVLRDIVVLGGTCAGALAGNTLLSKEVSQNSSKLAKSLGHLINNLSVPIGGIIGGLIFGEEAERAFPQKHTSIKEAVKETIESSLTENNQKEDLFNQSKNFTNKIDPGTIGKAYNYLGMGLGTVFDNTFSTLSGFKVGREEGLKNKLLKASNEVIAGVIIPVTTVVSLASYLKSKNMNNISKGIIVAPVAVISCYIGNALGDLFNQKITENLLKKEFWTQIAEREKTWKNKFFTIGFDVNQYKAYNQSLEELKKKIPHLIKSEKVKQKVSEP